MARGARARARGARSKQAGAAERNGARGGERAGESGYRHGLREGARNAGANPNTATASLVLCESQTLFPTAPSLCPRALAAGLGLFSGHGHHGHHGHLYLKLQNKIKGKSGLGEGGVVITDHPIFQESDIFFRGLPGRWPLWPCWPRVKSHTH